MRGLGLGETLLGELDVEAVSAGEAHDRGEIDGLGVGGGAENSKRQTPNTKHQTARD